MKPKGFSIMEIYDGKEFQYLHPNFELRLKIKKPKKITPAEYKKAVDSISHDVGWELRVLAAIEKEKDEQTD